MRTDADLAADFRGGDDRAFGILYERYKRAIYLFGRRMLGEPDAARDLVQDVFLKIYEKRAQLHDPENFRSWLFTAARNRCLSQLRHTRAWAPLDDAPDEALAVSPAAGSLEAAEEVRLLQLALGRLKVEYREVLVLREYQDLSYRDIAVITNSSESAVKSRLFKARRALHDALQQAITGRE